MKGSFCRFGFGLKLGSFNKQDLEKAEELEIKLPTSTGSWKKEYQSVLLFPSPEDLPNPEIKPGSPVS